MFLGISAVDGVGQNSGRIAHRVDSVIQKRDLFALRERWLQMDGFPLAFLPFELALAIPHTFGKALSV